MDRGALLAEVTSLREALQKAEERADKDRTKNEQLVEALAVQRAEVRTCLVFSTCLSSQRLFGPIKIEVELRRLTDSASRMTGR